MPRPPEFAPAISLMNRAVYSALAQRAAECGGEGYPLQIGDTYLEPAEGCRLEDLQAADHPGLHRYAPTRGLPALVHALAERRAVDPRQVLVSAGATGGLSSIVGAIVQPGDEVLLLAPYWPLIAGMVQAFKGRPVPVPCCGGAVESAEGAVAAVEAACTDRTVALYLNTPNNPTGQLLPREWLGALAEWARQRNLWILADEVYEDYVFDGTHVPIRPLAPERTFEVHSFSKAYGMAGNRVGYVLGPSGAITDQVRKVSTHTYYSTPTGAQLAALRAVEGHADAWLVKARAAYERAGAAAALRLGVEAPEGSTFLFLDVAAHLDDRGLEGFLLDCADQGLLVAPGPSFGPYPSHVRLCFTSAPPDVVARGVEVLARRMGR